MSVRRVGRWIFNGLTALSLTVLVVLSSLWLRSYWTQDAIISHHNEFDTSITTDGPSADFEVVMGTDRGYFQAVATYITRAHRGDAFWSDQIDSFRGVKHVSSDAAPVELTDMPKAYQSTPGAYTTYWKQAGSDFSSVAFADGTFLYHYVLPLGYVVGPWGGVADSVGGDVLAQKQSGERGCDDLEDLRLWMRNRDG